MKNNKTNNKKNNIAFCGVMIALALCFSYLESYIPVQAFIPIPGVKLGLANIVVVFALYSINTMDALFIGALRVVLAGFLFGNPVTIAYSLAGCFLSWGIMAIMKRTKLSIVGVSMLGGIFHNIGQIIVAIILTSTVRIAYYLPVLLVSGLITGFLMGYVSKLVVDKLSKITTTKG